MRKLIRILDVLGFEAPGRRRPSMNSARRRCEQPERLGRKLEGWRTAVPGEIAAPYDAACHHRYRRPAAPLPCLFKKTSLLQQVEDNFRKNSIDWNTSCFGIAEIHPCDWELITSAATGSDALDTDCIERTIAERRDGIKEGQVKLPVSTKKVLRKGKTREIW